MHVKKVRISKTWLVWTALLLMSLILTVQAFGSVESSQAFSPLAAGVTKSVEPPSIPPGQTLAPHYTVTFSNPATTTLILDWVTDTLPAGFVFVDMVPESDWHQDPVDPVGPVIVWQGPITVPATSTLSLIYAVYVPASVPPSSVPYVNTVIARAGETTLGPATAGLVVGAPNLNVTKTAEPARLLPGQPVDYTVTFANSGQLTGTLAVISDTLDPSLTFVEMLPGSDVTDPPAQVDNTLVWTGPFTLPASAGLVLKYQVDTSTAAGWHWPCNQVTALADDGPVDPARACVEVGPETASVYLPLILKNLHRWAEFTIAKSVTPTTVTDMAGEVVTYTVTIANIGNISGKLAAVVDTLPAGFTYLDMAAGSDVAADPVGATGLIRWPGPFTVAAGGQLRLIYRVAPSQTVGQYANSANVEVLFGKPPAGPASAWVTVERGVLLEEYFDNTIDNWTKFLNYWRLQPAQWYWEQNTGVSGGGANHECCGNPEKEAEDAVLMYLGEGAESWTNYRIEAKFNFHEGAGPVGVWVRGQYEPNDTRCQWMTGYYIVVGGRPTADYHTVKIAQLQTLTDCWGAACDNPQNLYCFNNPHDMADVQLPGALTRGVWHTLVVEVRDANIKVWYDGELSLDFTDPKEPFLMGTVGLKTYKAEWISYDNIIVTPLQ